MSSACADQLLISLQRYVHRRQQTPYYSISFSLAFLDFLLSFVQKRNRSMQDRKRSLKHLTGHDMQGSLVEELWSLVTRAEQPKATFLPAASKATTAFHQAVHSLVYDMLMQKVGPAALSLAYCLSAYFKC